MAKNNEERMYNLAELLLVVEQNEGSDAARFIRDKITEDLVKQKRTAVKIAAASYGHVIAPDEALSVDKNKRSFTDRKHKAIENSIWGSQKFYEEFSAEWTKYCQSFWARHIYKEDGLQSIGFNCS